MMSTVASIADRLARRPHALSHKHPLNFLGLALVLALMVGIGSHNSAAEGQTRTSSVPTTLSNVGAPGSVGNLWVAIGGIPAGTDLAQAAQRYDVVVLNAWNTDVLAKLKAANPSITALVYKDLSSTRSYAVRNGQDDRFIPTGVGYVEADPSWFAVDTAGKRIEWSPYPAHWQMKVWDARYQARWVANVTAEVKTQGWDGVFADNNMATLGFYSTALFQGTTSRAATDQLMRDGLDRLVDQAGTALNASGKLFVPNHSDGRLDLNRWRAASRFGGAMDEQFAHWGFDPVKGFITDWGRTGWRDQTAQLTAPLSLLITHSSSLDPKALRYGYGSALLGAQGRVVWTGDTNGAGYGRPEWFSWQALDLGAPAMEGRERASGVWVRRFDKGMVLVNPHLDQRSAAVDGSYCRPGGAKLPKKTRVSVGAHDAVMLVRC